MLIVGCEIVQTERREQEWRKLIAKEEDAISNDGYGVFGKPAEKVIKSFYSTK